MRYGAMNDLTACAKSTGLEDEGVCRAILVSSDQGFCTIEVAFDEDKKPVDYRFLEVSPSFERQSGIENAAGRWMRAIAAEQDQFWFDTYGRVALTGEPERFENFSTPLDRWWSVYAFKIEGPERIAVLFHDITDRKRAEAALRASEERFRGFVTASSDVVYRMSSDWSHMRQLDGQGFISDTPEPSEDWRDQYILPQDRGEVQEAIDRAIRTKSQFDLEHRVIRADGSPGWTKSRAIPVLGEHGEIAEWIGTASDITRAKSEREELCQSELRYRTLFEAIDSGFAILEMIFGEDGRAIDYRFVEANPAFERQSGLVGAVGRRIREFAPDLEEHWFERYGRVALTGESMRVEGEVAPLGRWFDINAFRVGAPEQRRVAVLFTDITARRNIEAELRGNEERQAFLLKLSDAIRPLGDPMEIQTAALRVLGEHLAVNRAFFNEVDEERDAYVVHRTYANGVAPLTGHFRLSEIRWTAELAGSGQIVVIDDAAADPRLGQAERASYAAMEVAAGVGVPLIKDGRWVAGLGVHHATPRHWTPQDIDLIRETADRTWAAVERARTEAELRESERRQGLLLAELQHRVRNILTMVSSIARRTADNCEDVDDYVRHLDGRLSSLARIQTILTRDAGRGVDLHSLVHDELINQATSPAQYQIEGPDVELSPKAAEVIGLALHELATNSVKYGVLAELNGTIRICWTVGDRDGQAWLRLMWNEPVGPKIDRPARTGFGTDLIRNRVPYELRGTGDLLIGGDELVAMIEFPLEPNLHRLEIGATALDMTP